ncbi:MAG: hypothetical protein IPK50_03620 [Fibrobacterota bacterium]|nr:hypothetical protein [Fibrobacterota bacterium]QQS05984.1 MAG: hypothetical protein IPK50_03620 [Fibrobacterota bacterium]
MIFALLLTLLSGRDIVWTDTTIGSAPISNKVQPGRIRVGSLAELAAVMDHSLRWGPRDEFRANDSLVRIFQRKPCRIGALDTIKGMKYALVDWRKNDTGFTYVVGFGKDSIRLLDFFHNRPTGYRHDSTGAWLYWSNSGNDCEKYSYYAHLEGGEFRFDLERTWEKYSKACKDEEAKKSFKARLRGELYRRNDLRCDVWRIFPSVGSCWADSEPEDEEELEEE